MRSIKRFTALLLALLMVFSLTGCSFLNFGQDFDTLLRGGGVKFSDMEYTRPDLDDMRSCVAGICDMLEDGAGYRRVTDALDEFYGYYWSFYTMSTLAELRSDLDTSDEYYAEEYEYCMDADAEVSALFDELMLACTDSDLKDELDNHYFGGMLESNYAGWYGNGMEKLLELYAQEAELLGDYREKLIEFYSVEDVEEAYRTYNPEIAQIYIDLIKVRKDIAAEVGYDSYEELAYADFGREYTPDDLEDYLAAIEEYIIPLFFAADEKGILETAYDNLSPSAPKDSLKIVKDTVGAMDEKLGKAMNYMTEYELYNVAESADKLEGSYTTYIDDYNSPFLFVNPECYEEDILTIAHEFGHFCDAYENYDTNYNLDTSEVMSQGMEYLLLCNLQDSKLQKKLTNFKMTDALYVYVNQACFNEFEHRAFALPDEELTVDNLNAIYAELAGKYGFGDGYGDVVGLSWIDINHIFEYPFYVISYCVSDSAAFGIYLMELENPGSGLKAYLEAMKDAPNMDFLDLMEDKGITSPISAETIKNIAEKVSENLGL